MKKNKFVLFSRVLAVCLLVLSAESLQAGKQKWQTRLVQTVESKNSTTTQGKMNDNLSCVNTSIEFRSTMSDSSLSGSTTVVDFSPRENGYTDQRACASYDFRDDSGRKLNAGMIRVRCDQGTFVVTSADCALRNPEPCSPSPNAYGERVYDPNIQDMGACEFRGCNGGYYTYGQSCFAPTVGCGIANGWGVQDYNGAGGYSPTCRLAGCNGGYSGSGNSCVPTVISCAAANGVGTQTFNGSGYGACNITSCNTGYYLYRGTCYIDYSSGGDGGGDGDGAGY